MITTSAISKWDDEIREFKIFLKLEKNLSNNSIDAYTKDITKFRDFIFYTERKNLTPTISGLQI